MLTDHKPLERTSKGHQLTEEGSIDIDGDTGGESLIDLDTQKANKETTVHKRPQAGGKKKERGRRPFHNSLPD